MNGTGDNVDPPVVFAITVPWLLSNSSPHSYVVLAFCTVIDFTVSLTVISICFDTPSYVNVILCLPVSKPSVVVPVFSKLSDPTSAVISLTFTLVFGNEIGSNVTPLFVVGVISPPFKSNVSP